MAKYLENFIIDLLSDSNKYSINKKTNFCLCKLLESLGLSNITIGFIENVYKNYNLSELSNIFLYNSSFLSSISLNETLFGDIYYILTLEKNFQDLYFFL